MKEAVNLEALQKTLQQYAELPDAKERERVRLWVAKAANSHYVKETREFNAVLHPLLFEVEAQIEQAQKPPAPTPAETNGFLLWAAKVVGGLVAIVGAGALFLDLVFGIGGAIRIWAISNAGAIGWVIGGLLVLAGCLALPKWNRAKEENEAGETPVQNQNIIVNVFTSQNGSVNVNSEK